MTLGVQNVSFVAQAVDWIPEVLYDIIKAAYHHKGLSFVRILQRCPEWLPKMLDPWVHDPLKIMLLHHEDGLTLSPNMSKVYKTQEQHDPCEHQPGARDRLARRSDPGRHPVPQSGRPLLRRVARCRTTAFGEIRQGGF